MSKIFDFSWKKIIIVIIIEIFLFITERTSEIYCKPCAPPPAKCPPCIDYVDILSISLMVIFGLYILIIIINKIRK